MKCRTIPQEVQFWNDSYNILLIVRINVNNSDTHAYSKLQSFQNFKIWQKISPLPFDNRRFSVHLRFISQKGVGPNAGDRNPQRFIVAEEDVLRSIHITIHHCSTGSTLVRLCSSKIPLDISATTARFAGVCFVDNSNLAPKLTTFESQALHTRFT